MTSKSGESFKPFSPCYYFVFYTLYGGEERLLLLIQDGSGGGIGVRLPGAGIVAADAHRQPDVGGVLPGIRRTRRDHRLENVIMITA